MTLSINKTILLLCLTGYLYKYGIPVYLLKWFHQFNAIKFFLMRYLCLNKNNCPCASDNQCENVNKNMNINTSTSDNNTEKTDQSKNTEVPMRLISPMALNNSGIDPTL